MPSQKPNILVATPCYGGLVTHLYVHSLLKLMSAKGSQPFTLGLITSAHDSLITRSRNALVKTFLDNPTASHVMFIDADIGFEAAAVHRFLELDEDVVAGMYPIKVTDWGRIATVARPGMDGETLRQAGTHFVGVPCVGDEREEKNGFVTAVYAGTGFMMIKRAVIERLIVAHPESAYQAMQTFPVSPQGGAPYHNLFDCMIEPGTGVYLSEDFTFCHKVRKAGIKVWLDTRTRLHHVGSAEFLGDPSFELLKYAAEAKPPA